MILSFFNWRVTALQCCVSFCCITKWISYMQFWSNLIVSTALRWSQFSLSWFVWRRNLAVFLPLFLCVWLSSLLKQKASRQGVSALPRLCPCPQVTRLALHTLLVNAWGRGLHRRWQGNDPLWVIQEGLSLSASPRSDSRHFYFPLDRLTC